MKVIYNGHELKLTFNENGNVFALYDDEGEMFDRLDPSGYYGRTEPNTAWVSELYVDLLLEHKVVEKTDVTEEGADGMLGILCNIVHPEFNDGGYSGFGDFARERLRQQCQYASRYIDGAIPGYPNLGEGLRFNNGRDYNGSVKPLKASDYHAVRIHRDDMEEFERRYKAYREEQLNG